MLKIKKAMWTCKDGEEITLIFDQEGNFDKFDKDVTEENQEQLQYESFPTWGEFDIRWEEINKEELLQQKGFKEGNNNYYLDITDKDTIKKYFKEDADKLEQIDDIDKITLYINSDLDGVSFSINNNIEEIEDDYQEVIEFIETL